MKYNFDEIIDRKDSNSISFEGWRHHFNVSADEVFPFANEDYIRMWVADMDLSTPPEILDAIRRRLDRKILGYTHILDPVYYDVLYRWFEKRYHWQIKKEEIVIAPGVVPALKRLVPLLTRSGEAVLILTPSYAPFKMAAHYNDRALVMSDMVLEEGRFVMDRADIRRKLEDPNLNIRLFILCNPQNPTGTCWKEEELRWLGDLCLQHDVWIISDEIHCDLLRVGRQHIPLATLFPGAERIITCTAPSKTFNLAGNLMSHIFIPDRHIRRTWNTLHQDLLSPLSIAATRAAYEECEEWLEALRQYLDLNFAFLKDTLSQVLPQARFDIPDATYLAWIDISDYLPMLPQQQQVALFLAREAGILLEDGSMFVANGEGYIRLNLACPRTVLEEGIRRLSHTLIRYAKR